jgi:hypothetical protein
LVLANVPFALIGGIIALHLTGMNFGISAGVGFIALFGICIQNGVILLSEFHHNIKWYGCCWLFSRSKSENPSCGNDGTNGIYWVNACAMSTVLVRNLKATRNCNYRRFGSATVLTLLDFPNYFLDF